MVPISSSAVHALKKPKALPSSIPTSTFGFSSSLSFSENSLSDALLSMARRFFRRTSTGESKFGVLAPDTAVEAGRRGVPTGRAAGGAACGPRFA